VTFEASNYYENKINGSGSDHSGYGIMNLRKRLELVYPEKHQLCIEQGDLFYHTKLTIDTNEN
jgi:two-component system, LytTR family, sensor kinase